MSHNIALLSPEKRVEIDLDKRAALLIWQLHIGKISRGDVMFEIQNTPEEQREYFRKSLNRYKAR